MKLKDMMENLYEQYPELKIQDEKEKSWRRNTERSYLLMGNTKEEANRMAWGDYWKMVAEKDGYSISFHEIREENNEL